MKIDLEYPIIIIRNYDKMVYVYNDNKTFKSTSEDLLKKIDYTKLDIIDSLGYQYKIDKVFKVKYAGFWGFNPFLKGRQIVIDFEFNQEIRKVALDDFKGKIIERIDNNKNFWEIAWDIKELKQQLHLCSTFSEIAKLLR